jgi:serine/threonine protein kinase
MATTCISEILEDREFIGSDNNRGRQKLIEQLKAYDNHIVTAAGDDMAHSAKITSELEFSSIITPTSDLSLLKKLKTVLKPHGISSMEAELFDEQLAKYVQKHLAEDSQTAETSQKPVFSSEWLKHLHDRGILLNPSQALDWSGRGQHVEYKANEEAEIPLKLKKVLGYSATAIVDSVQCRRILLARKTVRCNRRLTKENVISEVEHLQRVQHSHVVRVVGTYTIRKDLAILLYPAAHQNLEELMDEIVDLEPKDFEHGIHVMPDFFGCLSNAMSFIHSKNVKHMDIKPKNILVRRNGSRRKVYIADFGIARSYKSAAESFTDSPTSFTRTYAAPEVVMQDTRGFAADIFSLGCIFMEMLATMASTPTSDAREHLAQTRGGDYHANIDRVLAWYHDMGHKVLLEQNLYTFETGAPHNLRTTFALMLRRSPEERPLAIDLEQATARLCCGTCDDGPEPFEAADTSAAPGTDASAQQRDSN